jgi:ABC-type bacteriocin/lantibiotic exporter with double-glycine peptidase domain
VLIFDEATSALDGTTEKEVIDEISNLGEDVTIVIVTHSLSTLKNSDWVYKLDRGMIIKEGPPKSMLNEKL